MEVILLNDFCHVNGGASFAAIAAAREMAERGTPVTFLGAVGPIADELIHPNIDCLCLGQHEILHDPNKARAAAQGIFNRRAAAALRAILAQKDPTQTIIHLHLTTKALSPLVMKIALESGFPTVATLHDYSISCPNGAFLVHPITTICHRRPLSLSCVACSCDSRSYGHKLWRVARSTLQNKIWEIDHRLTAGIFPSRFAQRILDPLLPGLRLNRVVLYPVHAPRMTPAQPAQRLTYVFVGRFAREKGVLHFAEAARRAHVPALFIGDGDASIKREIRRLLPGVEITGWLPQAEITTALRDCRALIMPSLWYETLGLVAIEAMAQGLPVVVPDNCAVTEHVTDGVTGLFFRQGSIDDLTRKIELLRDDALVEKMGRAAHAWYWNNPWTVARHVDALERCYRDLLR
jgi:glycosyltransferase involved in cell wall biosynthesis